MEIEILVTGEELLCGSVLDANSAYIADRLLRESLSTSRHTVVGDDLREISAALLDSSSRADVLLVTGGLGPTNDDLTAEAASEASGRPLATSPDSGFPFPEGARLIDNPVGTAPGFALRIGACELYFLPGVPEEMRSMFEEFVLPEICSRSESSELKMGVSKLGRRSLVCFAVSESVVDEILETISASVPGLKVCVCARAPEVRIDLRIERPTEEEAEGLLAEVVNACEREFGEHLISSDGSSVYEVVASLLTSSSARLAIAESCTGGLIAHLLTQIPGISESLLCSVVAYSNESKVDLLGVDARSIGRFGAVSKEVVGEMALGVREKTGATFGLATSGVAGPSGGTPEKPVGTLCVAVSGESFLSCRKFSLCALRYGRTRRKELFAAYAVGELRKAMLAHFLLCPSADSGPFAAMAATYLWTINCGDFRYAK